MQALFLTVRFYDLKIYSYYFGANCVPLSPLTNSDLSCNKIKTESVISDYE